ncbi:hypothetical protein C1645_764462 [Glomus cerebriforme]|uniref:Uncharacterized protein n=1 Tax=Glomus cerebriforme TaxID=658196 RepID=A0A397T354_9GLOM|nr:hypothetical protein C1645_764462 [Glomus cerebriforme]
MDDYELVINTLNLLWNLWNIFLTAMHIRFIIQIIINEIFCKEDFIVFALYTIFLKGAIYCRMPKLVKIV